MKKLLSAALINTIIVSTVAYAGVDRIQKLHHEQELECLALNIYFETSASSLADAMAVSDVVLNRVNSTKFPDTVCKVVKQGKQDSNGKR